MNEACRGFSCRASFNNRGTVQSGDTATFSFTSSGEFPTGTRSYVYETRDGVQDANGALSFDQTSSSFVVLNSPGSEGVYQRWVVIRGPDNADLCMTNTASAQFLPP